VRDGAGGEGVTRLEYAEQRRPRDSAWSLVGFALALVAASFCGLAWWGLWRELRTGAASASADVSPLFYVALGAFAATCLVGLRRGRRRFAAAGLVLLVAAAAAMAVLVVGSPWSAPRRVQPALPASSR
jgi:hypothetical protein